MRRELHVQQTQELLTLMEGVTYAHAPYWYGITNQELKMDLLLPRNRKGLAPRPVLLWCCGGAFQVVSRAVWLPELQWYARQGFICAAMDYRIAVDAPYPAILEDVRAAVRFLRTQAEYFGIDASRIAVMGESAGGYAACMAGVTGDPASLTQVQAVVDFYGKIDMHDSKDLPGVVAQFLGNAPESMNIDQAMPYGYVNANTPPFLIFHGSADSLVPIAESDRLYETLNQHGVRADYYVLPGHGHGEDCFYQPQVKHIVLDFLREVLQL